MKMTIPIPCPSKANNYEIHFSNAFWAAIKDIVAGLTKYVKGPLYWIGPSKEMKVIETIIAFYVKRILEDDTSAPLRVRMWVSDKIDADNGLKAVLDAIQLSGRIQNDKQIKEVIVRKVPGNKNESFDLEIEKMDWPATTTG